MILSFHDRMTEAVFQGRRPKGFPPDLFKRARLKLGEVDAATRLDDLKAPPGNNLHALSRDRSGQHAIAEQAVPDLLRLDRRRAEARRVHRLSLRFRAMTNASDTIGSLRELFTGDASDIGETLSPLHPGEVLRDSFMAPLGLSAGAIAKALDLPRSRIERIAREEIGISTDTALRLGRYFGTTHQFWLNLQTRFESETLLAEIGPALERIEPRAKAASA